MTEQRPREKRGRGRPRGHSGAAERESMVLELLAQRGPMTRNALAEALYGLAAEENYSRVYLALSRLREAGRVAKGVDPDGPDTLWQLKTKEASA